MQDYKFKALKCCYEYLCTIPRTYFYKSQIVKHWNGNCFHFQHGRVVREETIINSLSAACNGEHIEKEKAIKLTSTWYCLNYFKDSK